MTASRRYVSPKRDAQAAATREAILQAFAAQLSSPGRATLSPSEAARRAGVSVRTVHMHFPTADDQIIPDCEREHMGPFVYATKSGSRSLRSYWRMPDRLYDDPDALADWARRSLAAAHRSAASRRHGGTYSPRS